MRFRRHEGEPVFGPLLETIAGRRLVRQAAVVLGAFLFGYLLTVIWLFPSKLFSTDHAVPRLLDLGVTEAKSRLTKAGFRMKLDPEMSHPKAPKGTVVWQDPAPGVVLPPNSPITLALSGSRIWRKPSRLAWIQRGRSTTRIGAVPPGASMPVTSWT